MGINKHGFNVTVSELEAAILCANDKGGLLLEITASPIGTIVKAAPDRKSDLTDVTDYTRW